MNAAKQLILFGDGLTRPDLDLNPADLSTLWQDSAGTTAVTADGDPVGRFWDRSGNTFWTQGTSGSRPTYKTNILNGYPVIRGDGTDDALSGDAAALNLARAVAGFTMLAVAKYGKAATQEQLFWLAINGVDNSRAGLNTNSTSFNLESGGRNADGGSFVGAMDDNAKSTSAFAVMTGLLDYAGGPVRLRVNGTQYGSSSFASPAATPNTASNSARLFANGAGTLFAQGDLARLLCWRRLLTTGETRRWERHLGQRYGIAVAG